MRNLFIVILTLYATQVFAQEELEQLGGNPQLAPRGHVLAKTAIDIENVVYIRDTLSLPFIDDFSSDKTKDYTFNVDEVQEVVWHRYHVNGVPFEDSITLSTVPTWIVNRISGQPLPDSTENFALVQHIGYDHNLTIIQVDTLWELYNQYLIDGLFNSSEISLSDTTIYNVSDTFYLAPADNSYWLNSDAYINGQYGVDPITIGVATFDGLDSLGQGRQPGNPNSHGVSDYLTSKPIFLDGKVDVELSFYYQPQGHGNDPNEPDSLVLEFYHAGDDEWRNQWAVPGELFKPFTYVQLSVDSIYLVDGFQFRFKNYATLSGDFDHWNIDYVRLDADRTSDDEELRDVAFVTNPGSILTEYQSVPWDHYSSSMVKSSVDYKVINMDASGSRLVRHYYQMLDTDGIDFYLSSENNNPALVPGIDDVTMSLDQTPANLFPDLTERKTYFVKHFYNIDLVSGEPGENDTAVFRQRFDSHYAYDDGSAEKAYGITGAGAKVAYKFNLAVADTITSIIMYNPSPIQASSNLFKIKVWADEDGVPAEEPLYESEYISPQYQTAGEQIAFERYELDTTVIVSGVYYIGFEQLDATKINVGFDENTVTNQHIYYNVSGDWHNTSFDGSLLMRPDFGYSKLLSVRTDIAEQEQISYKLYPNPFSGQINLEIAGQWTVQVFDIAGRLMKEATVVNRGSIAMDDLNNGTYMIQLTNEFGDVQHARIIKK